MSDTRTLCWVDFYNMYSALRSELNVFFDYDLVKVDEWMETKNLLLGGVSPNDMIKLGRLEPLLLFVTTCLEGNLP